MGRARLFILLSAFAFLASTIAMPAGAATPPQGPKSYVPKKGKPCKRGYKAKKRHRKRVCVKRRRQKQVGGDAGVLRFRVKFDSVIRDPLNPFRVTYSFSASATRAFASPALREVPETLPPGVISFFSDGSLKCALNVGGASAGGQCPVLYSALGDHVVTLVYSSGEASVSETRAESIAPLATSTALATAFRPDPTSLEVGISGYLDVVGSVSPTGTAMVGCLGGDSPACIDFIPSFFGGGCCGHTGYQMPLSGTRTFTVRFRDARFGVCFNQPVWEINAEDSDGNTLGFEGNRRWAVFENVAATLAGGTRHLLARSAVGNGYVPSTAIAPVRFVPQLPADPCEGDYGQLFFPYEDASTEPPPVEEGRTRVGTVQVSRTPAAMTVYCTRQDAIGGKGDCIPSGVDELAVYVSSPTANDCANLIFESESDPGVFFVRPRSEVEAGVAEFYGRGEGKWATGTMDFEPLLPVECS